MSAKTGRPDAVAAAEQEAAEAEQLAAALEERVREGDDSVTSEQIASARELGRFARLRTEATRRKAEKAKAAARLAACEALRADVEAYADGSGDRFAELLRTAEDAVRAFVAAVDERNDRIAQWRRAVVALGVPEHTNPTVPSKGHGNLGYNTLPAQLIAGTRRMQPTPAQDWLGRMLTDVVQDRGNSVRDIKVPYPSTVRGDAVYAQLATLDAPREAPGPMYFYRGSGGAVVEREQPYSSEDIARLDLTPISQKEAWGR
jgi:hypothetical protein